MVRPAGFKIQLLIALLNADCLHKTKGSLLCWAHRFGNRIDDVVEGVSRLKADRLAYSREVWHSATDVFEGFVVGVAVGLELDVRFRVDAVDGPFGEFEDGDRLVTANIVDAAYSVGRFDEFEYRSDDVVDVSEAADLAPVVMHNQRTVVNRRIDKSRKDHSVGPRLSRSDNVEEASDHDGDTEFLVERESQEFVDRLRDAVTPPRLGGGTEDEVVFLAPDFFGVFPIHFAGAGDEAGDVVAV